MIEFIVGEWYRNPGNFEGSDLTWAKFEKWQKSWFYFTEWITNGVYEIKGSRWSYSSSNSGYEPINIEEIRQYLPYGHPDIKILKNINYLKQILKKLNIK